MRSLLPVRAALLLLGVLGAQGACSSFGEGPDATPGGASDAGADPTTNGDATSAEAGPPRCAGLFCASFDGEPFDVEWDGYERGPQQQVDIGLGPLQESPRSPARALRLTIPSSTSLYQSNHLKKRIALPAGAHSFTYRFAVRLQAANTRDGSVRVANVEWGRAADDEPIAVRAYLEGANLTMRIDQPTGGALQETATRRLEVGRWYLMETRVTFHSPSNASMESFADGTSYDEKTFEPAAPLKDFVDLHVGGDYAAASWSPSMVDLDDVSFDAR